MWQEHEEPYSGHISRRRLQREFQQCPERTGLFVSMAIGSVGTANRGQSDDPNDSTPKSLGCVRWCVLEVSSARSDSWETTLRSQRSPDIVPVVFFTTTFPILSR